MKHHDLPLRALSYSPHHLDHLARSSRLKLTTVSIENNPEVMNALGKKLGLNTDILRFHDVYSLTDPDLLALIPRPVYALLVIIPPTPAWLEQRAAEDKDKLADGGYDDGSGRSWDDIIWFKQIIGHACGSIGLLHCLLNGYSREFLLPDSLAERLRSQAFGLKMEERAQMLYDSKEFEEAHQSVAEMGDTPAPSAENAEKIGGHFVAFVKVHTSPSPSTLSMHLVEEWR